jgi:hypothetical protein
MQDRNTKESRYMKKFQKNLRKMLLKNYASSSANDEYVKATIDEAIDALHIFDPVLDWNYKPICGCDLMGFELPCNNIKQNRLFERNGHVLFTSSEACVDDITTVVEGYEMWLLEDMRIVFTYFVRMWADDGENKVCMTYRYALGKKVPADMDMTLEDLLDEVCDQAFNARLC